MGAHGEGASPLKNFRSSEIAQGTHPSIASLSPVHVRAHFGAHRPRRLSVDLTRVTPSSIPPPREQKASTNATMPTELPSAPLPPPLTSDVPGTWAFDTMSRRVRSDILARIFRENDLQPAAVDRLRALDEELANAASTPLLPIAPDGGPDVDTWNEQILTDAFRDRLTWLSAPWALAEFYLCVVSLLLHLFPNLCCAEIGNSSG